MANNSNVIQVLTTGGVSGLNLSNPVDPLKNVYTKIVGMGSINDTTIFNLNGAVITLKGGTIMENNNIININVTSGVGLVVIGNKSSFPYNRCVSIVNALWDDTQIWDDTEIWDDNNAWYNE